MRTSSRRCQKNVTWQHNNITAIPDWAQKDKVANNGGFGKSEFHSHGNWILMAKSSKNWLHIGKHALLESSEKGKWNAKLSESDSDRELRGDYFYQLQYGKTSAHSKLRKKQSIERKRKQWLKGWIKEQLREYLWCKTEGESRGDNCLSKRNYGGRLKKNFCERKSVMARMMAMLLGLVSPSSMEGPSSSGLVKRLIGF